MNSQDVSQLIAQEIQQLKQSMIDDLSKQLRDIHVRRDAGDSIRMDHESNASDKDMDGSDWSS